MDALTVLTADHQKVRGLFSQFSDAKEAGNIDRMRELQTAIFRELEVHTAVEEEVFYPEAQRVGGEAEELVREGVEEHHVVDVLMAEIRELEPADEAWAAKMTVLVENVEHHAEEEESELFPKLRTAFGDERLARMGEQLLAAKQRRTGKPAGASGATRDELYDKAAEMDIPGRSSMSKEELEAAVGDEVS